MALLIAPGGLTGLAQGAVPKNVRAVQDVGDLGLTVAVTDDRDGSVVLTATSGDVSVHKRVYADGRYAVRLSRGAEDHIVISGTPDATTVTHGVQSAVLRPDRDPGFEAQARRARAWLARSGAVQRVRQIAAVLDHQDQVTPEALALRITGAVVAELMGDPGAVRRFSRAVAARNALRLRKAQSGGTGYSRTCWDTYQILVIQAANQLESCLTSFSTFNPIRNLCAFVWTLQVESAWFQFLACSSFPVK